MDEMPLFKEPVVALAMLFQNYIHPTNKARREAIEGGNYTEIYTKEDAQKYLKDIYKKNLELEVSGEETRILMIINQQFSSNIGQMSLVIQDMEAFSSLISDLKVGDGGVKNLIRAMIKNVSLSPLEKLKIIISRSFNGKSIFKDKYKVDPGNLKFKSSIMYKIYIVYVYKEGVITNEEFQSLFPNTSEEK